MKRFFFLLLLCLLCFRSVEAEAAFSYSRSITIDHTKVPNTDQSNFPVLVSGTYAYLATVANGGKVTNASGYDIGFYSNSDCATGKLNWETELYTAASGLVVYWIKIATVSHTADTVFYLCYGDSGISTDQSNATGVWDANFKGVWHLPNGSTLSATDSTSNGNNGTINGATATAGQIDGGSLHNGTTDYISTPNIDLTYAASAFSASAWSKATNDSNVKSVIRASVPTIDVAIVVNWTSLDAAAANKAVCGAHNSVTWVNQYVIGTSNVNDGSLHFLECTFDGSTLRMYVGGVLENSKVLGGSVATNNSVPWYIGRYPVTPAEFFEGTLDEVRVSNITRSADWIATEYNNQNSPSTFYTVSSACGHTLNLLGVGC